MNNKLEEIFSAMKLNDLMHRRDPMEKKRRTAMCVLAILGAVAVVAAIAYAVYRYMNPDYLDDFDDDFDDYEDDFDDYEDEYEDLSSDEDETDDSDVADVKVAEEDPVSEE